MYINTTGCNRTRTAVAFSHAPRRRLQILRLIYRYARCRSFRSVQIFCRPADEHGFIFSLRLFIFLPRTYAKTGRVQGRPPLFPRRLLPNTARTTFRKPRAREKRKFNVPLATPTRTATYADRLVNRRRRPKEKAGANRALILCRTCCSRRLWFSARETGANIARTPRHSRVCVSIGIRYEISATRRVYAG